MNSYRSFRVQPSWDTAFREKDSSIWFHEYGQGSTRHYKLFIQSNGYVTDAEGCRVSFLPPNLLQLRSDTHGIRKCFQSPDHIIHAPYAKDKQRQAHLSCMDISPSGELGLASASNNTITLWETATGAERRSLVGHSGEVYTCRFFPSGLAALTAGADMQLKIWCLLTGKCAATLAPGTAGALTGTGPSDELEPGGHRSGILDTGIIDRGRNIVAIDRLGWLRLWDVSTQLCICGIPLVPNAIRCPQAACPSLDEASCVAVKQHRELPIPVANGTVDNSWFHVLQTTSARATEVSTTDAVVAVGMGAGGAVQMYELGARSKGCVARFTLPHETGSIESCAFPKFLSCEPSSESHPLFERSVADTCAFADYSIFAGGSNGELACWDFRYPKVPLIKLTSENGAVTQIQVLVSPGGHKALLLVGRSDGRLIVYSFDPSHDQQQFNLDDSNLCALTDPTGIVGSTLELTGIDCEPVRGMVAIPNETNVGVWTASMSGTFRYYRKLATTVAFD